MVIMAKHVKRSKEDGKRVKSKRKRDDGIKQKFERRGRTSNELCKKRLEKEG